jgi:transcription elongation factor Elf1
MNTNEASLGRSAVQTYSSRQKRAFDGVLFSMECTARWLENACDPMHAAVEIRLAMAELKNCIADCESVGDAAEKDLNACPFCGGAEFEVSSEQVEHDSYAARIDCDVCEASFSTQYAESSEALAIHKVKAAWSRRAALPTEKGQEPVAWFYYEEDEFIRMYDSEEKAVAACEKFGGHWRAVVFAAPQQPAQSAEQDERGAWDGDSEESRAAFRAYDAHEPVSTRSSWQIWRDACAWQARAASTSANVAQVAEAIYQTRTIRMSEGYWMDSTKAIFDACAGDNYKRRIVYTDPPTQTAQTDAAREAAILKALEAIIELHDIPASEGLVVTARESQMAKIAADALTAARSASGGHA